MSSVAASSPAGVPSRYHPLQDNFLELNTLLKRMHLPSSALDIEGCLIGRPIAFIAPLKHIMCECHRGSAVAFADKYGLSPAVKDERFVELALKILRAEFGLLPPLTPQQFWTVGYAQKKVETLLLLAKKIIQKKTKSNPTKMNISMVATGDDLVRFSTESRPVPLPVAEEEISSKFPGFPESQILSSAVQPKTDTSHRNPQDAPCSKCMQSHDQISEGLNALERRLMREVATLSARVSILELSVKMITKEEKVTEVATSDPTPVAGSFADELVRSVMQKIKDTEGMLAKLNISKLRENTSRLE